MCKLFFWRALLSVLTLWLLPELGMTATQQHRPTHKKAVSAKKHSSKKSARQTAKHKVAAKSARPPAPLRDVDATNPILIQNAFEAYKKNDVAQLASVTRNMRGNVLEPWARYLQLKLNLAKPENDNDVRDFLAQMSGTLAAERLRNDWIVRLGKQGDWPTVLAEFPKLQQAELDAKCSYWQGRLVTQQDETILAEVHKLWFAQLDVPTVCRPLFDALVSSKRLNSEDIWARIHRYLEIKRITNAADYARYLPVKEEPDTARLQLALQHPERILQQASANSSGRRSEREIITFALLNLARQNADSAATRLQSIAEPWPAAERAYAWNAIAWQAALQHSPQSLSYYQHADFPDEGKLSLSEAQMTWRVRAALRLSQWPAVRDAILRLPPTLRAEPVWVYWLGRAQAALGNLEEAQTLFRKINTEAHFYGVLANNELSLPLRVPPLAAAASEEELQAAENNSSLKRALALISADMRPLGVAEWRWSLRGMNDRQLLAAAAMAKRAGALDRAIAAAASTITQHDYNLRFPTPYMERITTQAKTLALEPAWIYGLIRQESRFVETARSVAGARGLMQVMPATAKLVARKIGLPPEAANSSDKDTNITLGLHYLRMMMMSLNNQAALASAAYNAGPGRARRWLEDRPLEGAIYVETIPFTETRNYVQNVMSNTVYYAALMGGKVQSLKARLGIIAAKDTLSSATRSDGIALDPESGKEEPIIKLEEPR